MVDAQDGYLGNVVSSTELRLVTGRRVFSDGHTSPRVQRRAGRDRRVLRRFTMVLWFRVCDKLASETTHLD